MILYTEYSRCKISRTACVTAATAPTKTLGFLLLFVILFLVVVVVVVVVLLLLLLLVAALSRCFALPLHNERLQVFGGARG